MLSSSSQFSKHQPKWGKSIFGSLVSSLNEHAPIIFLAQKPIKVDTDHAIIL